MSKTIEGNKLTVMINRLLCEFQYWKFRCTDENNEQNEVTPSFHSSYSFLNCWKTFKSMAVTFLDFHFVSINCFIKNWT